MSVRVLVDRTYTQIAISLRLALMDTQDAQTYGDIIQDVLIPMPDDSRENAFDYVILLNVDVTTTADGTQDTPGMARRVETQESFHSQMPVSDWQSRCSD